MNTINLYLYENLLIENYAWVDLLLRKKYYIYALTINNYDEFCSAGFLDKDYDYDLEKETRYVRKRSEDDISNYEDDIDKIVKRLNCQSPNLSTQHKNIEYDDYEKYINQENYYDDEENDDYDDYDDYEKYINQENYYDDYENDDKDNNYEIEEERNQYIG